MSKKIIEYYLSQKDYCLTHMALEKLKNKRKLNELVDKTTGNSPKPSFNLVKSFEETNGSKTQEDEEDKRKKLKEGFETPSQNESTRVFDYMRDPGTRDLLDSSDSLDEIMLNMMENYKRGLVNDENSESSASAGSSSTGARDKTVGTSGEINLDYDHDLNHAGVYTKEEIVRIFKVKMSKLQLLYKKQLNILNENLIYERKKYLTIKKGENSTNVVTSNVEGKSSRVLQAAKKYRSLNGKELYLKQKYNPAHSESPHSIYNTSQINKCVYFQLGNRCSKQCIPPSKYCKEHILHDPLQILFSECGNSGQGASSGCKNPIIASLSPACALHLPNASGCLTSTELHKLIKLDERKLNSLAQIGLPEYPPECLRSLAMSSKTAANLTDLPPISNGSNLIRIKQEILDQSNQSSEDLVVDTETIGTTIEIKQEQKEYTVEQGDLEVIEEQNEDEEEETHVNKSPTNSRSSYSSTSTTSSNSSSSSGSTSSESTTSDDSDSDSSSTDLSTSSSSDSSNSGSDDEKVKIDPMSNTDSMSHSPLKKNEQI